MKILVVMNYRAHWGGLSGAAEELIHSLKGEGFSVDIASSYGRIRDRIKSIINIFRITPQYDVIMAIGCADYGFLPIFIGVMAAKINRRNVLVDFHSGYPLPFMRRFGRLAKIFIGNIPVTVASGYLFDIFKRYGFNVFRIPYHFHYECFPQKKKGFAWNKKILWAGTFDFMYDPETALRAARSVLTERSDIEFHFCGQGPLWAKLSKKYNHPNIVFKGFIPRNELLTQYHEYSMFLNTSFGDNFPVRLVEAAFNELLVISAKTSGTATVYGDSECLFFETGDYEALAKHILDVIEKPGCYDSFRENMHKKIMTFTWENVKDSWLKLVTTHQAQC